MKYIPLTQGKVALVDDEDFEWLNQWKWQASKTRNKFYVIRAGSKHIPRVLMHRLILGLKKGDGIVSDHKDDNGLNNQRYNLRKCTNSQNHQNQAPTGLGTSKYKGVSHCSNCNGWQVHIKHNGKSVWLGNYKNEIEAARVYDKKAKEIFGEFARLNNV